jgi:hypothetical protein
MNPTNPKESRRYIVVFNLFKQRQDCIRLVFPSGARVKDKSRLVDGDYAHGRRLAMFYSSKDVKDVRSKEKPYEQSSRNGKKLLQK